MKQNLTTNFSQVKKYLVQSGGSLVTQRNKKRFVPTPRVPETGFHRILLIAGILVGDVQYGETMTFHWVYEYEDYGGLKSDFSTLILYHVQIRQFYHVSKNKYT